MAPRTFTTTENGDGPAVPAHHRAGDRTSGAARDRLSGLPAPPPHEHLGEMHAVLGRGVEVALRIGLGGRLLGGIGDRRARRQRRRHARGQDRGRAHVDQPHAALTVAAPGGHTDDRPVLGAAVELLEAPAGTVHLRHADLGEHLVGRERGGEEALEEVGRRDLAGAVRALRHVGGTERQRVGGQVARRVAVGDRATDRAAVTHLRIADVAGRMGEQRHVLGEHRALLDVHVPRHRADRDVVAGVADVRQVGQPADVDQHARLGEPQLHERQQAVPTGDELGVLAVLADEADRLGS